MVIRLREIKILLPMAKWSYQSCSSCNVSCSAMRNENCRQPKRMMLPWWRQAEPSQPADTAVSLALSAAVTQSHTTHSLSPFTYTHNVTRDTLTVTIHLHTQCHTRHTHCHHSPTHTMSMSIDIAHHRQTNASSDELVSWCFMALSAQIGYIMP